MHRLSNLGFFSVVRVVKRDKGSSKKYVSNWCHAGNIFELDFSIPTVFRLKTPIKYTFYSVAAANSL